jgi:hypothetical protein
MPSFSPSNSITLGGLSRPGLPHPKYKTSLHYDHPSENDPEGGMK